MVKRVREDGCRLVIDVYNLRDIKEDEWSLLLNILGILEVLELEQSTKYNGSLPNNILEKMGKQILFPNWIRDYYGNFLGTTHFPFSYFTEMFGKKKVAIEKKALDKINQLQKNFTFYWMSPKDDMDEWRNWVIFITMLYVSTSKNVLYPMNYFAVSTLSKYIRGNSCLDLQPSRCFNGLVNKVLEDFRIQLPNHIDFPCFMMPYIEIEIRENMDANLALLRKMVWMNKLCLGIGEKETPEALLKGIGVIADNLKTDWGNENKWAKHKHGYFTNGQLLQIIANGLTVHFLHFPKK